MAQEDSIRGTRSKVRKPWPDGCLSPEVPESSRAASVAVPVLVLPLLLGACASPEWINPGTWFEDDPPRAETIVIPEDNSPVPNLGDVPTLPPLPSPQIQRQQITEGLQADRGNARYSDEPLTADSTAVPEAEPPRGAAGGGSTGGPSPFDVADVSGGNGGSSRGPSAPPPPVPAGRGTATEPGLSDPGSPAAPSVAQRRETVRAPAAQPTLLQHQAYQQLAQQQRQLQQQALANQAFEQEARQRAIEQQFLRQQAIEQQAVQRRALEFQARQLAGLPPTPQAPALQPSPPLFPSQPPIGGTAYGATVGARPSVAGPGAPLVGAPYVSAPAVPSSAPGGNLVGVIYFQHGSASLDATDQTVLRQVIALAQRSGAGLQVVGHASARTGSLDPTRHRMANLRISMARANRVADALAGLGAPRERIIVSAQADSQPVYHEFMPTGEAGNRRVEIYLRL